MTTSSRSESLAILEKYPKDSLDAFFKDAYAFTQAHHFQTLQYLSATPDLPLTPERFLSQYTWVVLVSGFKAEIVFKKFPEVRALLKEFDASKICVNHLIRSGLKIIANKSKWQSIYDGVRLLKSTPWEDFKGQYLSSVDAMEGLPHIGPTLKYHLARNLGFDVVKPDLHLTRMAAHFGVMGPDVLCNSVQISNPYAQSLNLGQIDYCIWCYLSHAGKVHQCCFQPLDTYLILR